MGRKKVDGCEGGCGVSCNYGSELIEAGKIAARCGGGCGVIVTARKATLKSCCAGDLGVDQNGR